MYPRVATAYDQNPARIQFVVIRKKESSKPIMEAIIGIYLIIWPGGGMLLELSSDLMEAGEPLLGEFGGQGFDVNRGILMSRENSDRRSMGAGTAARPAFTN